jgi:PAS domain S-box-containing protein
LSSEAIVLHQNGKFVFVNNSAVELFGARNSEELIGQPIKKFVHPDYHSLVDQRIGKILAEELKAPKIVEKFVKIDGTLIDVEVTAIPFNYHGQPAVQVVIHDITEQKRAKDKLEQSYRQVRELAEHLHTIREDERVAMSRDIHDDMGQILTALKIELSIIETELVTKDDLLKPENLLAEIKEMQNLVDEAIQSVRKLLKELRPDVLDNLGLLKAIIWQAEEFEKRNNVKCYFHSNVTEINLDKKKSVAILRILQEALTNITRHANATKVEIKLNLLDNEILLKVIDDGVGFSQKTLSERKTMGIVGMRERTLILGGEFEILSREGNGTTVLLSIPLNKPQALNNN